MPISSYQTNLNVSVYRDAFSLGNQDRFNAQLKESDRNFTYFVPSNQAWEKINREFSSAYKVLFMGDFAYTVRHDLVNHKSLHQAAFQFQSAVILERHLIIGEALSTADLIEQSQDGGISTLRGQIPFKFTEETDDDGKKKTFLLKFKLPTWMVFSGSSYVKITAGVLSAKIIRPNLECSNGVIHVIDSVIMERRDVTLGSGAEATNVPAVTSILASALAVLFARA